MVTECSDRLDSVYLVCKTEKKPNRNFGFDSVWVSFGWFFTKEIL